jgi:hypothetical protein
MNLAFQEIAQCLERVGIRGRWFNSISPDLELGSHGGGEEVDVTQAPQC